MVKKLEYLKINEEIKSLLLEGNLSVSKLEEYLREFYYDGWNDGFYAITCILNNEYVRNGIIEKKVVDKEIEEEIKYYREEMSKTKGIKE